MFAEDGRVASVVVDYNLGLDMTSLASRASNTVSQRVFHSGGTWLDPGTWSAAGMHRIVLLNTSTGYLFIDDVRIERSLN